MSAKSFKRLTNELNFLQKNPIPNINILNTENLYEWIIKIIGPLDTSYYGGIFYLSLCFPHNYPFQPPPTPLFISKIYHPNIHNDGYLCPCHYNEIVTNSWSPTNKVEDIIKKIYNLFFNPDFYYYCNKAAVNIYRYEGDIKERINKCIKRIEESILNEEYRLYSYSGMKFKGKIGKKFFKEDYKFY